MATPKNRSELQDVAHPGHKVVYRKGEDKDGKKAVFMHALPEIDAHDAVTRFPEEYSYREPENAGPVTLDEGADPFAIPPAAPAITSPAAPMGPVTDGVVMREAALTETAPRVVTDKGDPEARPVAMDGVTQKTVIDNEQAVEQSRVAKDNGKGK